MSENLWSSRWTKDQIKTMLIEQYEEFWSKQIGIDRFQLIEVEKAAKAPHSVIISGLRRVGKSTLLAQTARRLGREAFYYLNFEDERFLGFQSKDFQHLYQKLLEQFGERRIFIIDEIQNVPGWERFVRRFMDSNFKFYITGSNASLLSQELGTRLTGRYVPIELFPFSFKEFFLFNGEPLPDLKNLTTLQKVNLKKQLDRYIQLGGVPDALKYPELKLLKILYDDVLYRDITTRYSVDAVTAFKELAFFVMSNPSSLVSYNKLKENLGLGSVNTVKNFVEYLEKSWLIFTVNKYAFSVKKQQIAPKKIYCIDTGLLRAVGFHFSSDAGKMLENLVFLHLRRQTKSIFYLVTKGGLEVDFYLPETQVLIQVTYNMENQDTREREVRALREAFKEVKVKKALILSDTNEDSLVVDEKVIEIRSVSEWLLD